MKIGKIHALWISFLSTLYTVNTCGQSIIKHFSGKTNRAWVDATIHIWVDRLLRLIKVNYVIINPFQVQPQPGKATIIMCNHSSLYDIPLSFKAFPKHSIRMLAKKELAKIPIMGKGMEAAEFPFVDRRNRHRAIENLNYVRQLMESGIVVWIAPEGTRSKDGKLGPFKKGAFVMAIEAKATIIPIGIRGAFNILPPRTLQFKLKQSTEIHIGQPIDAAQYTIEDRDRLIDQVRESIQMLANEN